MCLRFPQTHGKACVSGKQRSERKTTPLRGGHTGGGNRSLPEPLEHRAHECCFCPCKITLETFWVLRGRCWSNERSSRIGPWIPGVSTCLGAVPLLVTEGLVLCRRIHSRVSDLVTYQRDPEASCRPSEFSQALVPRESPDAVTRRVAKPELPAWVRYIFSHGDSRSKLMSLVPTMGRWGHPSGDSNRL